MKIIIGGAGKVGLSIAGYLAKYDHEITVIDFSSKITKEVSEKYDVRGVCGFVSDPEVLAKADVQNADMIIAVTHLDEVNMIACEVAHALFGVPKKIARIRNQAYLQPQWAKLFEDSNLSVDVTISPEVEVARAIARSLSIPGAFSITPMINDLVNIIGVKCSSNTPIVNTPLTHITSIAADVNIRVIAISRANSHIIPQANEKLLAGDEVYFAVAKENLAPAMNAFGYHNQYSRRVLILGGGNVGLYLAKEIEKNLPDVEARIIEKSQERAGFIASQLTDTVVINGDALDSEILLEAGVETTEIVVAVTEDDKVNTLASLLAKQNGATRALALINLPASNALVSSLGVDSVINPQELTVSSILRHVLKGHIHSMYTLREGLGEIMEAEIHENSSLVGAKLIDVERPGELIVAAVVNKANEVVIPNQDTVFQLDDRIIIMAHGNVVRDVERMFAARVEYF